MANKVLSVVVPTYNMEAYLPRCLDSLTREDVPDTLEVIVVNDGSKDRSLEIAKEYQAKRPDIIQIIDKPNGHYGSCINAALKVATGKYFRILDADDWFDTSALVSFLNTIKAYDVDLIFSPKNEIANSRKKLVSSTILTPGKIYSKNDFDKLNCKKLLSILTIHSISYKLQLLKEAKLQLQTGICYTDTEFYAYPLRLSKALVFFDIPVYNYFIGREDQSTNRDVFFNNRAQFFLVQKRILENWNTIQTPLLEFALEQNLYLLYYNILFKAPKNQEDDSNLQVIETLLKVALPSLQRKLDRKLLYIPVLWRKTGLHFTFYETAKHVLGINK